MGGASKFLMLLSTPFPLLHHRAAALRLSRRIPLSASFSSAVGAGRRLIPSASRPRRPGFLLRAASESVHSQATGPYGEPSLGSLPVSRASHPWPEWARLVDHLVAAGYSERRSSVAVDDDDSFAVYEDLPAEFIRAAEACLSFARDRPDVLSLLSRNNIEAVVENGSPFLFNNGVHSARRMRLFLSGDANNVLESKRAQTVDVMRYVLSYAYNPLAISDESNHESRELVNTSVRNLLVELVNVSAAVRESKLQEPTQWQSTFRNEQVRGLPGQNIEMKRGDWICPKCNFMNFARNVRCFECDEGRPKRQLTGAEWECPQCDFFNYGRNMSCLRCDCKRPGEAPVATGVPGVGAGYNGNTRVDKILSGTNTDRSEIERRLAANDEKAERWFSKVSQLDDSSDISSAVADEDFPEIMPMRKGANRFVVSTRKTPLERRLANSQPGGLGRSGLSKTSDSSISQSLDRILGRTPSETNQQPATAEINTGSRSRFSSPEYRQSIANPKGDTDYVPFVPLPADMFSKSKKSNNDVSASQEKEDSASKKASELSDSLSKSSGNTTLNGNEEESSDASARWSKKVAELDNVTDLASAIPDEDFPEIMPMRKGENRFVVSKKKDRSLTSPQYKRRLAMEQANSSNFVPFVPFPPDYFAKKDKQPEAATPSSEAAPPCKEAAAESSALPEKAQGMPPKMEDLKAASPSEGSLGKMSQQPGSVAYSKSYNVQVSGNNWNEESNIGTAHSAPFPNSAQPPSKNSKESWNSGISRTSSASDGPNGTGSSTHQGHSSQNSRENWNQGFSGKSLEGSAVKEPDPLDMSEEAKAERWFRRVAQIKDISELSQIPDEDFPEIMPMRKGVNRFVVSKRKTPLERRLTSPQYRKNLPIVSSEPKEDTS